GSSGAASPRQTSTSTSTRCSSSSACSRAPSSLHRRASRRLALSCGSCADAGAGAGVGANAGAGADAPLTLALALALAPTLTLALTLALALTSSDPHRQARRIHRDRLAVTRRYPFDRPREHALDRRPCRVAILRRDLPHPALRQDLTAHAHGLQDQRRHEARVRRHVEQEVRDDQRPA